MPTPAGLNTTTLHGEFLEPNATGTPLQGSLTFTPSPAVINFPTQNVIVAGTETATLDVNGEFTIELISTDQAGENPTGWVYTVTEKLIGQKQRTYNIVLPYNAGVTLELSDITPTDAAPTYLPVVGPQGPPGVITTVNGKTGASITLTPADVGAIATTAAGAANGVATLDSGSKVPVGQLPSLTGTYVAVATRGVAGGVATLDGSTLVPVAQLPDLSSTYVTTSRIGAANGVAGLSASSLVPAAQLDLASATPSAVATTGAVGVATKLARSDHTHAGVDLANAQTVAGIKTFSAAPVLSSGATNQGSIDSTRSAGSSSILTGLVTADTVARFNLRADGLQEWGPGGSTARDTTLSRSGANELTASGQLVITTAAPTAAGHATRKDYVDNNFTTLTTAQTISGVKTFSAAPVLQAAAAGTTVANVKVTGDTVSRLTLGADGTMSWGPGNAAADVVVSRTSGSSLSNTSNWQSQRAATSGTAFTTLVNADTFDRWRVYADGKQEWGPGNATRDTDLFRNGIGLLKTNSIFNSQVESNTSAFTPASGFTLVALFIRRTAGITIADIYLTYTGGGITATAGNITDTACGTITAGWCPTHTTVYGGWDNGTVQGGFVVGTDGICTMRTASGNIATSSNIRMQAIYIQ